MKDLNNIPELLKYFRIIKPSEIDIDKGDIFYRDKYNDIINFLKVMLTNHDDKTLNGYIEPKGAILINLNPGTDIIDYIKLITKNYYLDLIEFNEVEIFNNPDKFLKSLISVIEFLIKDQREQGKNENENLELDKVEEKKLF